jgi:hypothetical protein
MHIINILSQNFTPKVSEVGALNPGPHPVATSVIGCHYGDLAALKGKSE